MTGPHSDTRDPATRPISVAELLARNGTIGAPPVTGRRRRRRGNSDAVTVAELTGEIPVIRDDDQQPDRGAPADEPTAPAPEDGVAEPDAEPAAAEPTDAEPTDAEPAVDEPAVDEPESVPEPVKGVGSSEPGSRWPKSMPQSQRASGPQQSNYPRPVRRSDSSGAEQMSPDPVHNYPAVAAVDVLDAEVRGAEPLAEDVAEVRTESLIRRTIFGWRRARAEAADAVEPAPGGGTDLDADRAGDLDDDHTDIEADLAGEPAPERSLWSELAGGAVIVLQSMLAVLLGAGLFIAFDQLWHWNNIVALVLTVLVTLGLVAAVQAVRRTVDIGSTLIAVAVGLLITLGPLALHAN
ncbi:MAG TPA: hypothetical protein VFR27_15540 [Mycobacterium sp.]|nr:hypothetical protein [Mycobacterium sp.]